MAYWHGSMELLYGVTISFSIRPDFDGLIIEPCISKGISEFKITRKFRGTIYNISVKNIGEGTVKITADNGVVNGTTVSSDAEICNVEVVM